MDSIEQTTFSQICHSIHDHVVSKDWKVSFIGGLPEQIEIFNKIFSEYADDCIKEKDFDNWDQNPNNVFEFPPIIIINFKEFRSCFIDLTENHNFLEYINEHVSYEQIILDAIYERKIIAEKELKIINQIGENYLDDIDTDLILFD